MIAAQLVAVLLRSDALNLAHGAVRKSPSLCSDDLSLVHATNQAGEPEAREVIASLFNEPLIPIE